MYNLIHIYFRNISKNYLKYFFELQKSSNVNYSLKRCIHIADDDQKLNENSLMEFHGLWPENEKNCFINEMQILPKFLSTEEESKLLEEVEPYLKRLRYEFDHWDNAIHGFRETERNKWYPHNRQTIQRISDIAFNGKIMPYLHVLDLEEKGVIKPHVDSTRYCGNTIAGVSLLSNSVMRLVRVDEKKYNNSNEVNHDIKDDSNYRDQPKSTSLADKFYVDILLPRLSLYVMSHSARYNFTHEILGNENSKFMGKSINKTRRVSIICRNEP